MTFRIISILQIHSKGIGQPRSAVEDIYPIGCAVRLNPKPRGFKANLTHGHACTIVDQFDKKILASSLTPFLFPIFLRFYNHFIIVYIKWRILKLIYRQKKTSQQRPSLEQEKCFHLSLAYERLNVVENDRKQQKFVAYVYKREVAGERKMS